MSIDEIKRLMNNNYGSGFKAYADHSPKRWNPQYTSEPSDVIVKDLEGNLKYIIPSSQINKDGTIKKERLLNE